MSRLPEQKKLLKLYDSGLSYAKLGRRFDVNPTTVMNHLRLAPGFRARSVGRTRRHQLNSAAFNDAETEASAYFLGLLMADGYNYCGGDRSRFVALDLIDRELVTAFRNYINPTKTLKLLRRQGVRGKPLYCCRVASRMLSERLERAGVTQTKGLTARLPKELSSTALHHFVRGLFDGDGSIFSHVAGLRSNYYRYSWRVVGTLTIVRELRTVLRSLLGVRASIRQTGNIHEIYVSGNQQIHTIGTWLYNGATIFLGRKRKRFDLLEAGLPKNGN